MQSMEFCWELLFGNIKFKRVIVKTKLSLINWCSLSFINHRNQLLFLIQKTKISKLEVYLGERVLAYYVQDSGFNSQYHESLNQPKPTELKLILNIFGSEGRWREFTKQPLKIFLNFCRLLSKIIYNQPIHFTL